MAHVNDEHTQAKVTSGEANSSLNKKRSIENEPNTKKAKISAIPVSMFGEPPVPDLVDHVRKFLIHTLKTNEKLRVQLEQHPKIESVEIEIESKLGEIIDKSTNLRIKLPIYDETICTYENVRFNSDMSMKQHKQFNQFLNSFVANPTSSYRTTYEHKIEVDEFVNTPEFKLRRTLDSKTRDIKQVIHKKRIGDLNIYMPAHPLDIRISVNLECKMKDSKTIGPSQHQRIKDRLSYTMNPFRVDLTQVKNHENVR